MKASEIRNLTNEEMELKLHDKEVELYKIKEQVRSGQSKKHRAIRTIKRDIARIKTVITERKAVKK